MPEASPEKSINLLKWPEEFQPEEAHIPCGFLAEDLGSNRGSLIGHET